MKILNLTLKKQWFDMIKSGEKTEEYREIKPYWNTRLLNQEYDFILFRNGYDKDSPEILIECKGIRTDLGKLYWGALPKEKVFILDLGKQIFIDTIINQCRHELIGGMWLDVLSKWHYVGMIKKNGVQVIDYPTDKAILAFKQLGLPRG